MQIHAVIKGKTNTHDAPFFTFDGYSLTDYNIAHASVVARSMKLCPQKFVSRH